MPRRRPTGAVRTFLLVVLAGFVLLLVIALADRRGYRLSVPSDSRVLVAPGQERCSSLIRPPGAGADRVRFWARTPGAGPDPGPDGFEASAEGDIDGNGKTSLFTRVGKVDKKTQTLARLTGTGKEAVESYWKDMEALRKSASGWLPGNLRPATSG